MQAELEDTILALLSSVTGSLLDNTALIDTLDASKVTWEEVRAWLYGKRWLTNVMREEVCAWLYGECTEHSVSFALAAFPWDSLALCLACRVGQ